MFHLFMCIISRFVVCSIREIAGSPLILALLLFTFSFRVTRRIELLVNFVKESENFIFFISINEICYLCHLHPQNEIICPNLGKRVSHMWGITSRDEIFIGKLCGTKAFVVGTFFPSFEAVETKSKREKLEEIQ